MKTMNAKGFTLIELMIVIAIIAIVASIAYGAFAGKNHINSIRGDDNVVVTQAVQNPGPVCIEGYKFVATYDQYAGTSTLIQIKDDSGNGVKCDAEG